MPNISHNANILCPYFLRLAHSGKAIICEGLVPKSETTNAFRKRDDLESWVTVVCEHCDYTKRCLVAAALEDIYE